MLCARFEYGKYEPVNDFSHLPCTRSAQLVQDIVAIRIESMLLSLPYAT